jgi:hypothetical protein
MNHVQRGFITTTVGKNTKTETFNPAPLPRIPETSAREKDLINLIEMCNAPKVKSTEVGGTGYLDRFISSSWFEGDAEDERHPNSTKKDNVGWGKDQHGREFMTIGPLKLRRNGDTERNIFLRIFRRYSDNNSPLVVTGNNMEGGLPCFHGALTTEDFNNFCNLVISKTPVVYEQFGCKKMFKLEWEG